MNTNLDNSPEDEYYYSLDGIDVEGPLPIKALYKKVIVDGSLPPTIQLCRKGTQEWINFANLPFEVFRQLSIKKPNPVKNENRTNPLELAQPVFDFKITEAPLSSVASEVQAKSNGCIGCAALVIGFLVLMFIIASIDSPASSAREKTLEEVLGSGKPTAQRDKEVEKWLRRNLPNIGR